MDPIAGPADRMIPCWPGEKVRLKDVTLILEAANTAGQQLPLSATHRRLREAAQAAGFGEADNRAVIRACDLPGRVAES
jgi:hypothetical protein